jgi:hypothetical protein
MGRTVTSNGRVIGGLNYGNNLPYFRPPIAVFWATDYRSLDHQSPYFRPPFQKIRFVSPCYIKTYVENRERRIIRNMSIKRISLFYKFMLKKKKSHV